MPLRTCRYSGTCETIVTQNLRQYDTDRIMHTIHERGAQQPERLQWYRSGAHETTKNEIESNLAPSLRWPRFAQPGEIGTWYPGLTAARPYHRQCQGQHPCTRGVGSRYSRRRVGLAGQRPHEVLTWTTYPGATFVLEVLLCTRPLTGGTSNRSSLPLSSSTSI